MTRFSIKTIFLAGLRAAPLGYGAFIERQFVWSSDHFQNKKSKEAILKKPRNILPHTRVIVLRIHDTIFSITGGNLF